ncbi:MAG TPA: AAA family ATPase [Chloroflexia bacterium]|nr:AAA family ATPase [Chloroflexia bacterium]
MNCPACQSDNPAAARFCIQCATPLDRVCPACGATAPPAARFCMQCATPLPGSAALPVAVTAPPVPFLDEDAPSLGGSDEGERKYLTILFADVTGVGSAGEEMDPETAREILGSAVERMLVQVERFGGTVNQVHGEGILALFGAPVAHDDDAERAIRSAWAIRQEMAAFGATVAARSGYEGFGARVGINTGLVVLGELGSDTRVKYTAIGDAVNLAARLQGAAPPGEIVISDSTLALARPCVTVRELGALQLKGKARSVSAYVVTGLQEGDEVARRPGQAMPLVGRDSDLAGLQQQWAAVRAGRGQVAVVVGDSGVGKSRLLTEFARLAATGEDGTLQIWDGRGQSYRQGWSYGLFSSLLRRYWGIPTDAADVDVRGGLAAGLAETLGGAATGALPHLARMFGLPAGTATEQERALEGRALQTEIFATVQRLAAALLVRGPLLITVDDLHWADPTSIDLLESLLPRTETSPLMILVLTRPGHPESAERFRTRATAEYPAATRTYSLAPLTTEQSHTLIAQLLGSAQLSPALEALVGLIQEKAEGNPFYLEEVLHGLVDQGVLARDGAGWTVTRAVAEIEIPNSLHGVLQARIDRLPDQARRVLQLASVIGRTFSHRFLQSLSPDGGRLDRALAILRESDLIQDRGGPGERTYGFHHGMTQEIAYGTMLLRRRRAVHGRLAAAIEAMDPDGAGGHYALLAHHYDLSDNAQQAIQYLLLAGQQALDLFANQEALALHRRALARLEAAGSAAAPADMMRAQRNLGILLYNAGDLAAAEGHFRAALAIAGNPDERAAMHGEVARVWGWRGKMDQALAEIEAGLAEAPGRLETARLHRLQGTLQLMLGNYPAAIARLESVLPILKAGGAIRDWDEASRMLGLAHQLQGHLDKAGEYFEQVLYAAQLRGDQGKIVEARNALGYVALQQGNLPRAESHLRDAQAIIEQRNLQVALPPVLNSLGDTFRARGDTQTAEGLYARSRELSARNEQALELGQALCGLAELALTAGASDQAKALLAACAPLIEADKELEAQYYLTLARQALAAGDLAGAAAAAAQAHATTIPLAQGVAERVRGQVAARQGRLTDAAAAFAGSAERLEESGALLELAHTLAAWAGAGLGTEEESAVLRTRAAELYAGCGAPAPTEIAQAAEPVGLRPG